MPPLDEGNATADSLYRLHSLLVDAVRHRRGQDPQQGPVTVAEIYQDLVPYRHVRTALGLELNADYEHTLLRLLAGEEQLARLEPETAREQLARELESANPNVTLYRKFAACDVWLLQSSVAVTPAWLDEHLSDEAGPIGRVPMDSAPGADDSIIPEDYLEEGFAPEPQFDGEPFDGESSGAGAGLEESLPAARGVRPAGYSRRTFTVAEDVADDEELEATLARALGPDEDYRTGEEDADADVARTETGEDDSENPRPGYCMFCDSALPQGRTARYCPYCGADQQQRPCSACGEAVEPGWAFCIACGEPAVPPVLE